ncbi:EF-hand domain-containing protein [Yoonia sp. MH D7]
MKSTVLIAAMIAGFSLVALDATAAGRGEQRAMPDFATLDADGNGSLTVAEMEAAHGARFTAMDTDGNGDVSLEELTEAGAKQMAERAEHMLSQMDTNKDGMLQADEMKPRGANAERMISHADQNDDGEISQEEFEQMIEKRGEHGERGGRGERDGHGRKG